MENRVKWDVTGPELDEETRLVTSQLVDDVEEVDVNDVVEEVDGGIGDRADQPNAGEGEFNRMPLSFSSVCGGEG